MNHECIDKMEDQALSLTFRQFKSYNLFCLYSSLTVFIVINEIINRCKDNMDWNFKRT